MTKPIALLLALVLTGCSAAAARPPVEAGTATWWTETGGTGDAVAQDRAESAIRAWGSALALPADLAARRAVVSNDAADRAAVVRAHFTEPFVARLESALAGAVNDASYDAYTAYDLQVTRRTYATPAFVVFEGFSHHRGADGTWMTRPLVQFQVHLRGGLVERLDEVVREPV